MTDMWSLFRRKSPPPAAPRPPGMFYLDESGELRRTSHASPSQSAPAPPPPELDPNWATYESIAALIIAETKVEEIHRGVEYSDEQRAIIFDAKARKLASDYVYAQANLQVLWETRGVLEQIAENSGQIPVLLRQQVDVQPVRQLQKLWREHPFLMGFMGADVVSRLKRRLG